MASDVPKEPSELPKIDLSRLSEAELTGVKEVVLRDLLREAASGARRMAAGYDKHSSLHSKS